MGEDRTGTGRRRVSVAQAAEELGVSVEAVRGRIKRGTLQAVREDDHVFVLLEADQSQPDALIDAKDETIALLRDQLEAERQAHAEARRIIAGLVERIPPAIEAPSQEAPSRNRDGEEARERPVSAAPGNRPTDTTEDAHRDRQAAAYERRAAADERQVAALQRQWTDDTPDVGDGGPQSGSERPWWRRMFGG